MCGIVGAVSTRNIVPILIEGLKRLEYRGYDSCGVAVHQGGELRRARSTARVAELRSRRAGRRHRLRHRHRPHPLGHARRAGGAQRAPALLGRARRGRHDHRLRRAGRADAGAATARIALVHNGIIENHDELRAELQQRGYVFDSQTDTEVIAHLVDSLYDGDLFDAVQRALPRLHGAYAIAVFCRDEPQRVVGAREGSPLILGVGTDGAGEHFLASDAMALAGVTDQIVYLEEGDVVDLQLGKAWITAAERRADAATGPCSARCAPCRRTAARPSWARTATTCRRKSSSSRAPLPTRWKAWRASAPSCSATAPTRVFKEIDHVLILACGTSYYSGSTGKYWLESIAGIPTTVEIASEYRYRDSVPNPRTLVVTITQSGETADTLAALKHARSLGMQHTLTICNVATSAMVRECELAYITRAGVEIGVASTKAFTTQLAGLFLLTLALAQVRGRLSDAQEAAHLKALRHLPVALQAVLALEPQIIAWSEDFARKENALFLGRGLHYPIALEGALKLKEISYIHAEAYPAGELKHGPLALVTDRHAGGDGGAQRRAAGKAQEQPAGSARPRRRALRVGRRRHAHRERAPACT